MKKQKRDDFVSKYWTLAVGLFAMALLVVGTASQGGSLQQKVLFIVGAPLLGFTAYMDGRKMFMMLQAVATLGAAIAFLPMLPDAAKYVLMAAGALFGIAYLLKSRYFQTDKYGVVGVLGLLLIAVGFVIDPLKYAFWFDAFLGFGGLTVAAYSAISLSRGVKIAAIWLVLNVLFAISPLVDLARLLGHY